METKHIKAAEKVLNDFLKALQDKNPAIMVKYCQKTWVNTHESKDKLLYLSEMTVFLSDFKWEVKSNKVIGEACIDFHVSIIRQLPEITNTFRFRLICETASYTPSLDGEWGVNPISRTEVII